MLLKSIPGGADRVVRVKHKLVCVKIEDIIEVVNLFHTEVPTTFFSK